jgi:hypothetical protein
MRVSVTGADLIRQADWPGGGRERPAIVLPNPIAGLDLGRALPQERRNPAFGLAV